MLKTWIFLCFISLAWMVERSSHLSIWENKNDLEKIQEGPSFEIIKDTLANTDLQAFHISAY